MRSVIAAALALFAASSLQAQTTAAPAAPPSTATARVAPAPALDLSTATPIDGNWNYATLQGGSEATFVNASGQPQLAITCTRGTRQITISKPATGAAPFILVWTNALTRNLPSSYNPATARLSATVSAFDPVLDAMTFSRGRIGFSALNQPALVVPAWAEVGRVVEDCRA
jgi:hypothetical protein